ncbi:glycosyltransferase family 69 protein, partial [Cadophora sp. DSE1049]
NETVFIAANIIDGDLISGAWGQSLLELVESIGKERVWVSIYGGPTSALRGLEKRLLGAGMERERMWCVSEEEEPLDMSRIPRTALPTGESRVKRIAWLAEVRNKVLEPLYSSHPPIKPAKLLFLNDIYFNPSSALRLLWGTNLDSEGIARYKAVCAVDFVKSWKFYDTFATRDAEGYSIGVPVFPWFVHEGEGRSRRDVLEGRDSVRVRSCWGGMVAFEGRLKAAKANNGLDVPSLPLRFRSEPEPFWDSSECCLIHADIMALPSLSSSASSLSKSNEEDPWDTGIYMNPYVRTSYSASTHRHIWLAKRFERLFSPVQRVLNYWAGMPRWNYRRMEKEGEKVRDRLWISEYWGNEGYYVDYERTAKRGGYCGVRQLLVMK